MEEQNKNKIMTEEKDQEKSETNTIATTIGKIYNGDVEEEEEEEAVVVETTTRYCLLDEFVRAVIRCLGLNTQEEPSRRIDVGDLTATSEPATATGFSSVTTMDITGMLRRKPPTPPLAKGREPQHH